MQHRHWLIYPSMQQLSLLLVTSLFSGQLLLLSLACTSPYQPAGGLCVYRHPTVTSSVCDAAKICQDHIGVIITPDDVVQSGLSVPNMIWVSVSDSLIERGKDRSGWRYFNGSEYKNTVQWHAGEPSDNGPGEDVLMLGGVYGFRLNDVPSTYGKNFVICSYEEPATKNAASFREDSSLTAIFEIGLEQGCYETEVATSKYECSLRCLNKWSECRSFYFSAEMKQCVMAMFMDSTLPASYNTVDNDWKRFVSDES